MLTDYDNSPNTCTAVPPPPESKSNTSLYAVEKPEKLTQPWLLELRKKMPTIRKDELKTSFAENDNLTCKKTYRHRLRACLHGGRVPRLTELPS